MSDLLPCPFCGGANLGLLRHVSYFPHGVMCRDCFSSATSIERWNTRALPAVRPDAAAIRKAALQEAADVPGSWARTWKRKAERTESMESDGWAEDAQTCFDLEAEILALIDNPPHVNETPKTEHDREDVLTPDATEIREAARALSLIDKPGKEEALVKMARLGQEFDAAIFSDVEGLYGEDKTRKEVSNEQVARR